MTTIAMQAPPVALAVALRADEDGPELTREPASEADLLDAHSEFWLHGCLRKGRPDVRLEEFPYRLVPLLKDGGPRCSGFALEDGADDRPTIRCEFSIHALGDVAERAAERLRATKQLKTGDLYYYEVIADRRPRPSGAGQADDVLFTVTAKPAPLTYLTLPLAPLLKKARTVGELDEHTYPVFYTEEVLARAERFARKGGDSTPPIETGAVLVGPLCHCPETGEFFGVVCDALEVHDAEKTQFSLTYSSKSWARIQAVMKARQSQAATRAHRILGQCHGHNFLPANGAPPCEHCLKVKVCTRTTVFVSADDRTWTRAVFSRQPWQLCHIYGLNARNEKVEGLFGLRDGRLVERGYHVIPEFRA
jgi:hypothetical protein